jgi:hypothetical protein
MTSNDNCISHNTVTGSKTLTVLPMGLPAVSIKADPGDTVCQFSLTTFTAQPLYGGPSPLYTWMVNGVVAGTGSEYAYLPVQGDAIGVTMVSDYLCRLANTAASSNVDMTVDSIIVPHVTVTSDSGLAVTAGHQVTLRATATNAGPTPYYQWKVNGHNITGATESTYTSTFHDYDSITCMVTSSGVCHNIATFDWVFISVFSEGVQPVNGSASDIRLIPNPNNGVFTIKGTLGTTDATVNIEITDMLGQIVYTGNTQAIKGKLDQQIHLENTLANGVYLLSLKTQNETKIFHFVMEQ